MSKSFAECGGDLLGQRREQIDAEAHVAGLDDGRVCLAASAIAASAAASKPVVPMTWTLPVGGQARERDASPSGLVKSTMASDGGNNGRGIARNGDAERSSAGEFADVLAEHGRARRLRGAADRAAGLGRDRADQFAAHAAGRAHHGDLHVAPVMARD